MTDKIVLSKEQQDRAISEIQTYFQCEREEDIGNLGGMLMLDFITTKLGRFYYNQAIEDVQKHLHEKVEDLYGMML
ncbi:MAG: DUF2164 domain-containing protein [Hyphomonadaceae bacterium]|nr:DUF2164 domain-containing protein [Clostridia bacterium]